MGLHQYVSEAQRWATRGQVMLDGPAADLEKELGVKHALHKKKLILALEAKGRSQDQAAPMPILPGKVHYLLTAFGTTLEKCWENF
jgi:SAM domain (Sterile alpha motif)